MASKEREIRLEDFHISRYTGFLIDQPLLELPKQYAVWHELASSAAERVKSKTFRQAVDQMPVLDHRNLKTHKERSLAHTQLTLISACYMWQDGNAGAPEALPASVSIPWWNISEELGIQASVNHSAFVLSNWRVVDTNKPWSLDNLDVLYRWPGGESARWFILISVQTEKDFADGLLHIEQGIRSVLSGDDESIIKSIHGVQQVIWKMKSTLSLTHDRVDPSDFFDRLLPFLSGWGGEGSPLPEGLIYTGVSDRPKKVSRRSGAQTSVIQTIDVFLGVQHNESETEFIQHMRNYMPPDHKQFIERIESGPSLRQYVKDSTNDTLKTAFENCVDALIAFRSYHLTIVTKYTVVMARRNGILPRLVTGGPNVLGFLKGFRSTTESARI